MSSFRHWPRTGWLAILLVWLPALSAADERILAYEVDIAIHGDGSLEVAETIRVRSEGQNIRQGIYRDFPLDYRDRAGNRYRVGFDLLEVRRNGRPEPYHTERRRNGQRIYIGRKGDFLTPGTHEYLLRYRTTRQLGFFDGYDELYWNVTGTAWAFPIDRVAAQVRLPAAVTEDALRLAFYTGAQGATGQDASVHLKSDATVEFATTRGLNPNEGLTIAVGWPAGHVARPTTTQKLARFLADNNAAIALGLGLLIPLVWYVWSWHKVGRDPRKGVIIPRFEPPPGISPAGCRYILDMSLGKQAFSAAVISLGVKGYLRITQDEDDFTLYRRAYSNPVETSAGERAVLDALLPEGSRSISLEPDSHSEFRRARSGLKIALDAEHKGRLFKLNLIYTVPAMLTSVLAGIVAIPLHAGPALWIAYAVLSMLLHVLFIFLLRAPTRLGRRVMDEIEGLRMYLRTAERDRLERMRSPALTPEVFEMFLPFAFALGVENQWCERFAREFPELQEGYRTEWYSGHLGSSDGLGHISSSLGSELSGAIASASTPPGSSSGSGGGGFSGGGGGGGGGGGW